MSDSSSRRFSAKLVLLGETGVGKTAISSRYLQNSFAGDQLPTMGVEFHRKTVSVNGESVDLAIWDTAGQELYRALTPQYYRDAQMALVVFALDDGHSFKETQYWINSVRTQTPNAVILLAGNKADLTGHRNISLEDATDYAKSFGIQYVETSAVTGQGVDIVFQKAVEMYLDKQQEFVDITPPRPSQSPDRALDFPPATPEETSCC
jgi:Rab family protein